MFGRAVFETIVVKGHLRLNFEAANYLGSSESLIANLKKIKADLRMTNVSKVLNYLTLISFFLHYLQE